MSPLSDRVTAAVLTGPQKIKIEKFDKPDPEPRDLLMKVKYCGVCGSDVHLWQGDWNPPYPLILGHEFIGEVAEAGKETLEWRGLKKGDQIAVEMILPCNKCKWCQEGYYNLCRYDDRSITPEYGRQYGCNIPITRPPALWGGYSQYLYVPEYAILHKYKKRVDWKEAALTEPLAVSTRAIRLSQICAGDYVVVGGPGTIGLMAVVAAKAAGAGSIILVGTRDSRLKVGELLGADNTINIQKGLDPVEEVKKLTNGIGADIVVETAGTTLAQEQSFKMTRRGGTIVLVGLTGGRSLTITPDKDIVSKEQTVKGSFLSAHAYQEAMKIIESQEFALDKVTTHVFPLEEVEEAFQAVTKRKDEVIKALLDPWEPKR